MKSRIKRVTEPLGDADGARIPVGRPWPHGRSKEKLKLAAWPFMASDNQYGNAVVLAGYLCERAPRKRAKAG